MEPPIYRWLDLAQVTWNWQLKWDGGRLWDLTLCLGSVKIELNRRTPSWHLRIAWCRKNLHTFGDQKYREQSVEKKKQNFPLHC